MTLEFASPTATHGSGSDLNTSSLRSGDKERESNLGAAKSHRTCRIISPYILVCVCLFVCV
ncbi:hypothetical protein EXN66_Car011246 [Channa argus]|uniref:Uncharacterized protein n=1 Tax=Channa argus TaxID=215402 RepID=A0A6G1PZ09_CHAAH|nr:hypothetical protein EXN66_Car011246 [Channa argus]